MYSSVQFVEHANKYSTATVSSQSVAELKQVALAPQPRTEVGRDYQSLEPANASRSIGLSGQYLYLDRPDQRYLESIVVDWLQKTKDEVRVNPHGFPDLVAMDGEDAHGFDVKYVRSFERMLVSPAVINSLLRGYLETREGRLSEFTMILIISDSDFFEIGNSDRVHELNHRLGRLLSKYPVTGIVVGAVLNDKFEPLTYLRDGGQETD